MSSAAKETMQIKVKQKRKEISILEESP